MNCWKRRQLGRMAEVKRRRGLRILSQNGQKAQAVQEKQRQGQDLAVVAANAEVSVDAAQGERHRLGQYR